MLQSKNIIFIFLSIWCGGWKHISWIKWTCSKVFTDTSDNTDLETVKSFSINLSEMYTNIKISKEYFAMQSLNSPSALPEWLSKSFYWGKVCKPMQNGNCIDSSYTRLNYHSINVNS